jgi:hypothetical protein
LSRFSHGFVGVDVDVLTASNAADDAIADARSLMLGFAERTGVGAPHGARRYLWTDAFAVCNCLGLARATGDEGFAALAVRLIDDVHAVLGRHRGDDGRHGWLSGLPDEAARAHPTVGGLRIGKLLGERASDEPWDERLEWERDGQYFHYLTRWMHALDQAARAMGEPRFNLWARELAATAHRAFTTGSIGRPGRRMFWKMSVDLSRALVPSMGQHDALDGLVTYTQLGATARALGAAGEGPRLDEALSDFGSIVAGQDLATPDPLGTGGLLTDASVVAALAHHGAFTDGALLERIVAAALEGLREFARAGELQAPAERRLAFRELGLAIGLAAARRAAAALGPRARAAARACLEEILRHASLGTAIREFWRDPRHRQARTWREHADINDVMLATALAPAGYLVAAPLPR